MEVESANGNGFSWREFDRGLDRYANCVTPDHLQNIHSSGHNACLSLCSRTLPIIHYSPTATSPQSALPLFAYISSCKQRSCVPSSPALASCHSPD